MPEPLRTRPRGSLLTSFFNSRFERSRGSIRRFLLRRECTWPEYIEPDALMRALKDSAASEREKLLAWMAFTYEQWMQKLGALPTSDS